MFQYTPKDTLYNRTRNEGKSQFTAVIKELNEDVINKEAQIKLRKEKKEQKIQKEKEALREQRFQQWCMRTEQKILEEGANLILNCNSVSVFDQ